MRVIVVTGTGTSVGKTVVAAAVAALALAAGRRVAVVKPVQTGVGPGEPGDLEEVRRLAGEATVRELSRYPEPLAPATAARRAGRQPVRPAQVAATVVNLASSHDLVLVEGAGGLLVRFDDEGTTLADVAWAVGAPVLIVCAAGLGTLNATALTAEALRRRGISCAGLVIGAWPRDPGLAACCNLEDLPVVADAPLVGVLPAGIAALPRGEFLFAARQWLDPSLGGEFDAKRFATAQCA